MKKSSSDWLNSVNAEWKTQFSCFPGLPGTAEAQVIWGGIVKRRLIAYFIHNICQKNINMFTCSKVIASQRWDFFETLCRFIRKIAVTPNIVRVVIIYQSSAFVTNHRTCLSGYPSHASRNSRTRKFYKGTHRPVLRLNGQRWDLNGRSFIVPTLHKSSTLSVIRIQYCNAERQKSRSPG